VQPLVIPPARRGCLGSIGFTDNDFDEERLALVRDACASISNKGRTRIVPIFADARKKLSASTA
jgi:hypothetical protein